MAAHKKNAVKHVLGVSFSVPICCKGFETKKFNSLVMFKNSH
jgi:hypothetical protein